MSKGVKVWMLERTCLACPSLWEGIAEDGKEVWIRYRHGDLTVTKGDEDIYEAVHGDDWAGYMDTEDMLRHTGLILVGEVDEDAWELG